MIVIYKDSIQTIEKEYPNKDVSKPVSGLEKDIKYYWIEETMPENQNPEFFDLILQPLELTDEIHKEYSHLKIAKKVWILKQKTNDEIIRLLNEDFGNYVDTEYPIPTRIKHLDEFLNEPIPERISYITKLKDWLKECRYVRDQRESELINNNILPLFGGYPVKP